MNRLNSIALLAGGALVAVAATGCSSNPAKSAAPGPAAGSSSAAGTPGTPASSTPGGAAPSTGTNTAAPSGAASTGDPAAPPTTAPAAGGLTTAPAAASGHPVCDNASLNASLAPAGPGQKASVAVIAVKNTGPTCTVGPIPYLWIVTSPTDVSNETRPLVPATDSGKKLIILSGTTLYAAIDLNPKAAANAVPGYGYLDVTANPSKDTSGKDVQDVRLAAPASVAGAMLSIYALTPAGAIGQIQYATTQEQ